MIKKIVFILSSIVVCLTMTECAQQTVNLEQRINYIFRDFEIPGTPGCVVAVIHHGKVIHKKGYGLANLEYNIPITTSTIFDIASVSKQFTGLAISTLIEEGKLSLDDDVHKYVKEVPDFGYAITVRHLLHHTSGLRDWPSTLHAAGWRWDETFSFEDILRMIRKQKELDFVPGDQYSYSNTGYNLLALIVENISGMSFKQWTREHIFLPLSMNSSFFLDDPKKIIKGLAYSYSPEYSGYVKDLSALTASGSSSIFTSADDLIQWVIHFNQQLKDKNPVYVNMLREDILNNKDSVHYGYGLGLRRQGSYSVISHTGGWAGYRTIISNYPQEELSIIILSNHGDFNPNMYANRVAALFLPVPIAIGSNPVMDTFKKYPTIALDTALAKKYTGMFKLDGGWYINLTLEKGKLWTQANGESKYPMTPKTPHDFWIDNYKASLHFLQNPNGSVDTVIYKNFRAPRIVPMITDSNYLNTYTGKYVSEELSTEYVIDYDGQNLILHHFRLGDIKLDPDPVTKGLFSSELGSIEFDTINGSVSGLKLSGERIKHIRFDKKNYEK